jgi:galactokinase
MDAERVAAAFGRAWGHPPDACWSSPGRVNIIGEHTDYNGGFVLPVALEFGVAVAASPRSDGRLTARSLQEPGVDLAVAIDRLAPGDIGGWAAYPAGVVWALATAGQVVPGLDLVVDGDVPQGAGLSSSAALECATAMACNDLFDLGLDRPDLALLAQEAENDFVGMPCGIMDQTASLLCRRGHALFLDTLTLDTEQVPLELADHGLAVVVIDTNAPHRLVDGEYANRRRTCEAAARLLGVTQLRELDPADLPAVESDLEEPVMRRRVRHVVTENARVLDVVSLLEKGDIRAIGPALVASHASLRDDYEVTVPELDVAVDAALDAGAIGARMTGGGFGGCAIALVEAADVTTVVGAVTDAFAEHGFAAPDAWPVRAADGARRLC